MTKMKKLLALVFCALIIVPMIYTPKVSAATAGWVQDGSEWKYRKSDGSYAQSEWLKINNKWYYFDYMEEMVANTDYKVGDDWYYFGKSGAMQTNYWNDCGSYWEYYKSNGKMAHKEWVKVNNKWYYFMNNGHMVSDGFYTIDGSLYEFAASGAMLHGNESGWQSIKGSDGKVASWYYVNSNGSLKTGWQKINNKWYYFDGYGKIKNYGKTQVLWIENKAYCFDKNGAMLGNGGGWIKGEWCKYYYIIQTGEITEWLYNWYYANSNGSLKTGWQKINGTWYYFDTYNCNMYLDGTFTIDGKSYTFNKSGAWVS